MKRFKQTFRSIQIKNGFTLLELIVVLAIVSLTSAWALPEFQRTIAQAKIDRYTQNLAAGLFSLRAKMGAIKGSCEINFEQKSTFEINKFVHPADIVERQQLDGTRSNDDPLNTCRSQYNADDQINEKGLRIVNLEGSRERDHVEVASTSKTYSFTPPGTTTNNNALILLIRAKELNSSMAKNSKRMLTLRTRCIEVTGNGQIFSGTWLKTDNKCKRN